MNTERVLTWRKSSYSNGDCVEIAVPGPSAIAVRDSKDPDGPQLSFSDDAWGCFAQAVAAGEFGDI